MTTKNPLHLLVDWHNLISIHPGFNVRSTAERAWHVLRSLDGRIETSTSRLEVRLYGGWRGWNGPMDVTRDAARLSAEILTDFPFPLRNPAVTVNAVLAENLLCVPGQVLPSTLRRQQSPKKLYCHEPSRTGCLQPACVLSPLPAFFRARRCPEPSCGLPIEDFIRVVDQKLVDTMIVTDLIHLASEGDMVLGLLTSDDDIWPGILKALSLGAKVLHLRTLARSSERLYLPRVFPPPANYRHARI